MGAVAPAVAQRRILIVDDFELNRTLTAAVLRGATYEVDSVDDGPAALAALGRKQYDLVLMDLEMPGLGGHEAAAAIRRAETGVPRLAALSARSGEVDRQRSAEVGMAHIARPIAPHELLREIERVFLATAIAAPVDPWQRRHYEEWVARLGSERMRGFLLKLRDQFCALLALTFEVQPGEALHRLAHDVASTSGMLGFLDVTHCCRGLRESAPDDDVAGPTGELRDALEAAVARLDRHFAAIEYREAEV